MHQKIQHAVYRILVENDHMLTVLRILVLTFQGLALAAFILRLTLVSKGVIPKKQKADKWLIGLSLGCLIAALICRLLGGLFFPISPIEDTLWFVVVLVSGAILLVFGLPLLLNRPFKHYKYGLAKSLALAIASLAFFGIVAGTMISLIWAVSGFI